MESLAQNFKSGKGFAFFAFLFVLLIVVDQVAKKNALDVFRNANFAFSLPLPVWLMYAVYFLVLGGLIFYAFKNYRRLNNLSFLGLTFIFAGALSNIFERIFLGSVRDFIHIVFYRWVGIYNFADFYIIIGILVLLFADTKSKNQQ